MSIVCLKPQHQSVAFADWCCGIKVQKKSALTGVCIDWSRLEEVCIDWSRLEEVCIDWSRLEEVGIDLGWPGCLNPELNLKGVVLLSTVTFGHIGCHLLV